MLKASKIELRQEIKYDIKVLAEKKKLLREKKNIYLEQIENKF